jgi:hypothetical protein
MEQFCGYLIRLVEMTVLYSIWYNENIVIISETVGIFQAMIKTYFMLPFWHSPTDCIKLLEASLKIDGNARTSNTSVEH